MNPEILRALIVAEFGRRFDANETAFLTRQTLFVRAQTADVLYAPTKSRLFIPTKTPPAPPGVESISYLQYDRVGMAKIIANYAKDFPRVDVLVKEFPRKVHGVGDSYGWSVTDMRRAARAGLPLSEMKARAARDFIERRFDQLAATGIAGNSSWEGFLNNSNIPLVSPTTGTWSGASAAEIAADIQKLVSSIVTTSKEVHTPDTVLVCPAHFALLQQPMSVTNPDLTVMKWLLSNDPYIKRIEMWTRLDLANADSDGPRVVAYQLDPMILYQEVPIEFEQFPPQLDHMDYVTDCHGETGGTVVPYPLGCAFMDGC